LIVLIVHAHQRAKAH